MAESKISSETQLGQERKDMLDSIKDVKWDNGNGIEGVSFYVSGVILTASKIIGEALKELNSVEEEAYKAEMGHHCLNYSILALHNKLTKWHEEAEARAA